MTLNRTNIYPDPAISRHPYLPLFLYIEAFTLFLTAWFALPQIVLLKIVFLLFHLLSVRAVFQLCGHNWKKTILYAFNPLSLFIVGFHGQFDIIPLALMLQALVYLKSRQYSRMIFLLSLAVTIKTWPILFLIPYLRRTPRSYWPYLALIPVITVLLYIFLFQSSLFQIVRVLMVYQGVSGLWGLGWLFSLLHFPKIAFIGVKLLFVLSLLAYSWKNRLPSPIEELVQLFLFFFIFTPGFGIQWFLWMVPFFFLSKKPYFPTLAIPIGIVLLVTYISWLPHSLIPARASNLVLTCAYFLFPLYSMLLYSLPKRK